MANYTIFSANSLTEGTTAADLFVVRTALAATLVGNAGNDTLTAGPLASQFANSQWLGGGGADSIYLTANPATNAGVASFLLGGGDDLLVGSALSTNVSTILGGGGNDLIRLQGAGTNHIDANFNGNAGNDQISASGGAFTRGLVAGGGGTDTINLETLGVTNLLTVNGGGGNDSIFLSAAGATNLSGIRIDGDTTQESEFFGNDSVSVQGANMTASYVQLAGGNDIFQQDGVALGTTTTIEGGAGNDSIHIGLVAANSNVLLAAGAGIDTIIVSGGFAAGFGTIQGGGGADIINVTAGANAQLGNIIGGADGDVIGLGVVNGVFTTGQAGAASGIAVSYESFGQSTLANTDVISAAGATTGGHGFLVTQSAVNFAAVTNGQFGPQGNQFTVASGQRVAGATFAAGTVSLTQRAQALDAGLTAGQSVIFEVGGSRYLFVQAGAAGSGTDGDLVAQLVLGASEFAASGGGITFTNNSAIQIKF
jgi:hypothetical protein